MVHLNGVGLYANENANFMHTIGFVDMKLGSGIFLLTSPGSPWISRFKIHLFLVANEDTSGYKYVH